MDKPKESKVRTRVMEILRNHDQEARVIEAQIAAEKVLAGKSVHSALLWFVGSKGKTPARSLL